MSRVAFLGLGTMGRGMVRNLTAAGHDVVVWNRTPNRAAPDQVRVADSIAQAMEGAEFVLYCLSDDAAVSAVVMDAGGVLESATSEMTVIDLSTISVELSDAEHSAFQSRGVRFLDAPVFGSRDEALAGGLWTVVGGAEDVVSRARPVLEAISASVHHMGPAGAGARMKLIGNLVVATQLLALGEALTLGQKAGLNLEDVLGVLAVTDFRSPIFDGVGPSVVAGDYTPAFALKLMQKDARLIESFAQAVNAPVPSVEAAHTYIDRAVAAGWAEENASALIKAVAADAGARLSA